MPNWDELIVLKRPMYLDKLSVPGDAAVFDVTSRTDDKGLIQLSPFHLGPLEIEGYGQCQIFENAWQYLKVYEKHAGGDGNPNDEWNLWRSQGFSSDRANRFPMGKGLKPLYHYYKEEKLGMIEARQKLYFPLYRDLVKKTKSYKQLKDNVRAAKGRICLLDFDGNDSVSAIQSMHSAVENQNRSMGHAYILKAMLVYGDDVALDEIPRGSSNAQPNLDADGPQIDMFS